MAVGGLSPLALGPGVVQLQVIGAHGQEDHVRTLGQAGLGRPDGLDLAAYALQLLGQQAAVRVVGVDDGNAQLAQFLQLGRGGTQQRFSFQQRPACGSAACVLVRGGIHAQFSRAPRLAVQSPREWVTR